MSPAEMVPKGKLDAHGAAKKNDKGNNGVQFWSPDATNKPRKRLPIRTPQLNWRHASWAGRTARVFSVVAP